MISQLAEEHAQVQQQKRDEEDQADQNMEILNTSVGLYTVLELLAILATIVVELLCLRSFLRCHKVI